jgi:hypothetical protein
VRWRLALCWGFHGNQLLDLLTTLDKEHCREVPATPSKRGTKGKREVTNLECSITFEGSSVAKERGLCQHYEVWLVMSRVPSCSFWWVLRVGWGCCFGFCGSLFPFCFLFSWYSFCILPVYLGALYTFNII